MADEYCAEPRWLDAVAMVCSRPIVDGGCPWHGPDAKRLPVRPDPAVAAAESRGRAAGYAEAVQALRATETIMAAQNAEADEWHRDQCACDAWPDDCRTYPARGDMRGRQFVAVDSHTMGVSAFALAAVIEARATTEETPR